MLDAFFNHVLKLSNFYHWYEQETCHQLHASLCSTALTHVKCAPSQPHPWNDLRGFLLKTFRHRT